MNVVAACFNFVAWVFVAVLVKGRLEGLRLSAVAARADVVLPARKVLGPATRTRTRTRTRTWSARPADVVLPAALITWIIALRLVNVEAMDDWGLLRSLPIAFFAALGLLVLSIVLVLTDVRLSPVRLGLHLVALVLVLHGTVPLLFPTPTYPWVYKHVGVVGYISLHGALDPSIDIYQNWPGFFALASWVTQVSGVGSPLSFAKWAPVYFNALIGLELAFVLRWLHLDRRVAWLSLFLFTAGNWVGQDYFAPQALAFVLSLGVFGLTLALLQVDRAPALAASAGRLVGRLTGAGAAADEADPPDGARPPVAGWVRHLAIGLLLSVYAVVVIVHQLSPFLVLMGVGLLALAGLIRSRWVVVVMAVLSVGYFMLHLAYLKDNGHLLGSPLNPRDLLHVLSNPFDNAHSVKSSGTNPLPGRRLTALGAPALILGLWAVGGLGAIRRLRARRPTLLLTILAASPALLALVQNYGGEAIFRVYLFSLPWTAVLVASAVAPRSLRWGARSAVAATLTLTVVIVLFMAAFYGSVELYQVRPGAVTASQYFYDHAAPGSGLGLVSPNVPTRVGAGYDRFVSGSTPPPLSNLDEFQHHMLGPADLAGLSALYQDHAVATQGDLYLFLSGDQAEYTRVLGLMPAGALTGLDLALGQSKQWRLSYRNSDAVIYQFLRAAKPAGAP